MGFRDRFVEIQMDGTSSTSYREKTIASLLSDSLIEQGVPGVLLLDEFQRFRTIDKDGADVKIERMNDVWMLLSDGKFSADSSMFKEIEMLIASSMYEQDRREAEETDNIKKINFHLYPYEARQIKKTLRLTPTIAEIMLWDNKRLMNEIDTALNQSAGLQLDYTKVLIFISGNLDEAFYANDSIDDCDTDANVFHERTKRICVTDIKKSLTKRFRAEQISRFGNNHIIYPSISKEAYQQIIATVCKQYIESMTRITGINFVLDKESENIIYANSVYPTQGTRPVFSSIHTIFSDGLVQIAFWAIANEIDSVLMSINQQDSVLIGKGANKIVEIPITLDLDSIQKKATPNFLYTVAVHEASHALVYIILCHSVPLEVKINTSSYRGGYTIPRINDYILSSKQSIINSIAVLYAGRVSESLVFGEEAVTSGAASDLISATRLASEYVREYAMDKLLGVEISESNGQTPEGLLPMQSSSDRIEEILLLGKNLALSVLTEHKHLLIRIVDRLLIVKTLNTKEIIDLLPELNLVDPTDCVQQWKNFKHEILELGNEL